MDTDPQKNAEQRPDEVIDLSGADLEGGVSVEKWKLKESSAKAVAEWLMAIFGGSLLLILAITFAVFVRSESPEQAQAYANVLTPILKELAAFTSSVFAPLLAFILGYYFSDKGKA